MRAGRCERERNGVHEALLHNVGVQPRLPCPTKSFGNVIIVQFAAVPHRLTAGGAIDRRSHLPGYATLLWGDSSGDGAAV
jgi:hypothetical protein